MPVRFNGNTLRPAPFVDIQKQYQRGNDRLLESVLYNFTLTGTIVNIDNVLTDSPGAIADTEMVGILAEQERIRTIFGSGIGLLEIESPNSTDNKISTYAEVESINFDRGTWVNRSEYTINLSANSLIGEEDPVSSLESADDNWSITENEDGTFSVSHTVQAQGRSIWTGDGLPSGIMTQNDPLEEAKNWVLSKSITNTTTGTWTGDGIFSLSNLVNPLESGVNLWNKSTTETVDNETYTWSLTENFVYNPSGSTREEWSASVNYDNGVTNRATVSVNGSIFGYADKISNTDLRYSNANNSYYSSVEPNIYTRVTNYLPDGYTLNPNFISKQVTHDISLGAIRYSINYSATSGAALVSGAIDESVNISDVGYTDVFAQIQVPGRTNGPVVQSMHTTTLPERTVSISATLGPSEVISSASLLAQYLSKPNTDDIINALKPSSGYYFIRQNSEEWNPIRRQYSRTVSWTIQPEGAVVLGLPSGINNISS